MRKQHLSLTGITLLLCSTHICGQAPTASSQATQGNPAATVIPRPDVPLNPTALEAVRVNEKWRAENVSPVGGADGRVIYNFGAGLPTVVCAPLRVCMIELQAGEKLEGEPQIGDSVRWNIAPALYGNADQTTPIIVLKPQQAGLDTNLLITTDRRAYYLRLISKPSDYISRIAFQYPPDQNSQRWQEQISEQNRKQRESKIHAESAGSPIDAEKLNFNYRVTAKSSTFRPVRVFDDGSKTYIQMPEDMQNREAPVLLILGKDGKGEMSNYRVKQQTYIVDRLFDRAQLILGSGKKSQKTEITRVGPRG